SAGTSARHLLLVSTTALRPTVPEPTPMWSVRRSAQFTSTNQLLIPAGAGAEYRSRLPSRDFAFRWGTNNFFSSLGRPVKIFCPQLRVSAQHVPIFVPRD